MMASLAIGNALGSVEKMDDEFGFGGKGGNPLPSRVVRPDVRGRRPLVTIGSMEETSEGDP